MEDELVGRGSRMAQHLHGEPIQGVTHVVVGPRDAPSRWGRWNHGVLECWSVGVLECWSVGVLEDWSNGVLG
jgi:hypothetical protein